MCVLPVIPSLTLVAKIINHRHQEELFILLCGKIYEGNT